MHYLRHLDNFNLRNPYQKCFLAWQVCQVIIIVLMIIIFPFLSCAFVQTYDLLQIMYYGFTGLCEDFLTTHPDYLISPIRINGSAVERVFSCLKYISGGHLSSINYSSSLTALATQRDVAINPTAEKGYRTDLNQLK